MTDNPQRAAAEARAKEPSVYAHLISAQLREKELENQRDQWRLKHDVACDTITRMQYERKERHKHCVKADDYVQATAEAADEFNRHHEDMLRIIETKDVQLTTARAVIEEAEKALVSVQQTMGYEFLRPEFESCADALTRIREWKEGK